ncbi:MAG TPA: pyruvate formate lyase family protein [Clostridiales bacterium]|nr:pyruvate formate lyase family protein [Clostridiales bacterium]
MKNLLSDHERISQKAKALFKEERSLKRLDGWFLAREAALQASQTLKNEQKEVRAALELSAIIDSLPLSISENAIFAGTQRDAFARSYALINPTFEVETFSGYCDPTAVFNDIEENDEFTRERINALREKTRQTDYVKSLMDVYKKYGNFTAEVAFFVEQVTGHLIPDFRPALKYGVEAIAQEVRGRMEDENDELKKNVFKAIIISLEAVVRLANRYADIVAEQRKSAKGIRGEELELMEYTLRKVPAKGADTLYEAMQSYMLLWQVMCLEQAPNPFAFSVGNADRIFEPYRQKSGENRDETAALFKHFLTFYNVGDRSWAISQNVLLGGKSSSGEDLTSETTYAILDAYYDMNLPQPILSVKLHKDTPQKFYRELGRFFFTPGALTPSLFNDDSMFEVLRKVGVEDNDLEDYSVAGCQEPLIMGKDNANTTNSWFNLPKILELTLNNGHSTITGEKVATAVKETDALELLKNIRDNFYKNVEYFASEMADAANGASIALSNLPVPFLSAFMGGAYTGIDLRDTKRQGTKYNGSGCLIHGLSVIADSLIAIDCLVKDRPQDAEAFLEALRNNFEGYEELRNYLVGCPKFGNNVEDVDSEAADIARRVSQIVASQRNYLGNPFRPDWSSPSTHLLYGYWVGATPDGRKAREQINYGVDPLFGEAGSGMGFRMLSNMQLPFGDFCGGYASHFGIDPKFFKADTYEGKGEEFAQRVITPLFFNEHNQGICPYYLYVNVTTPETLRAVLADPEKYAPSGVYIMRIHGTFVNFLDLSPAIQQDIIKRLDLESTAL